MCVSCRVVYLPEYLPESNQCVSDILVFLQSLCYLVAVCAGAMICWLVIESVHRVLTKECLKRSEPAARHQQPAAAA